MRRIIDFGSDALCFLIALLASVYTDNMIYGIAFMFCALNSLWHVFHQNGMDPRKGLDINSNYEAAV